MVESQLQAFTRLSASRVCLDGARRVVLHHAYMYCPCTFLVYPPAFLVIPRSPAMAYSDGGLWVSTFDEMGRRCW